MRIIFMTLTLAAFGSSAVFGADAKAGAAVYNAHCKSCHGADGTANPAIAKMFKVEIPDLKSAEVQGMSDAALKAVITNGKGKMRPMPSVSGADLDNVVAYVKSMK